MTKKANNHLQRYLRDVAKKPGMSMQKISRGAGLHSDFVRDVLRGKSNNPTAENLQRIAKFLGVSMEEMIGAPIPVQGKRPASTELDNIRETICRRLACAVMACWGSQIDLAAERLGVTDTVLRQVMSGKAVADELLLIQMVRVTKVTLDFIFFGKIAQPMPTEIAALIGKCCPDLVEWPGPAMAVLS